MRAVEPSSTRTRVDDAGDSTLRGRERRAALTIDAILRYVYRVLEACAYVDRVLEARAGYRRSYAPSSAPERYRARALLALASARGSGGLEPAFSAGRA